MPTKKVMPLEYKKIMPVEWFFYFCDIISTYEDIGVQADTLPFLKDLPI